MNNNGGDFFFKSSASGTVGIHRWNRMQVQSRREQSRAQLSW